MMTKGKITVTHNEMTDLVLIYNLGQDFVSVCSGLPVGVVVRFVRERLGADWNLAEDNFADGSSNPCGCQDVIGNKHYLFSRSPARALGLGVQGAGYA